MGRVPMDDDDYGDVEREGAARGRTPSEVAGDAVDHFAKPPPPAEDELDPPLEGEEPAP